MEPDSFELWERQFAADRRNEQQMIEWMKMGIERGWITPPLCIAHDPVPMTRSEFESILNEDEPCIFYLRIITLPVHEVEG